MKYIDEVRLTLTAALVVFITLKLAGLVDWSWWFVLAPFWAPVALGFLMVPILVWRRRRHAGA